MGRQPSRNGADPSAHWVLPIIWPSPRPPCAQWGTTASTLVRHVAVAAPRSVSTVGVCRAGLDAAVTDLTVVLPTFNKADNVRPLIAQLDDALTDVVVVDDRHRRPHPRRRRAGPRGVLAAGLAAPPARARGSARRGRDRRSAGGAVTVGGGHGWRLQHPTATAPELYRQGLVSGADSVVATRYLRTGSARGLDSRMRRVVSTASGVTARGLFPRRLAGCTDPMSGFFAVRRDALHFEDVTQCGYQLLLALLVHRRLRAVEVPLVLGARTVEVSEDSVRAALRYLRQLALLRTGINGANGSLSLIPAGASR